MSGRRFWLAIVAVTVLLRLLTLSAYPLHDKTEARYAEIARIMLETNNWVTPQIDPGVPFWAKPPLSTWTTAASLSLFGETEFAARLPALLFLVLTLALLYRVGRSCYSSEAGIAAGAILVSSMIGFVAAGAVMTDAALLFATTLSLTSFCLALSNPVPAARYGLFAGLGIGLLAKGPIAIVLTGIPILVWALWQRRIAWLWRTFPWTLGSLVVLAIAGPWYWLAETRTPGFLEYFLVGEHVLRFIDSGWQGDMYGRAHARPRGTIWIFGLIAALPWSLVAAYAIWTARATSLSVRAWTPLERFLVLWALTPMVFFTLAGNILPAYVLPGIPAFALLLGQWASERSEWLAPAALIVPLLIAVSAASGLLASADKHSQRDLVRRHYGAYPDKTLYYYPTLPESASFYSDGRARALESDVELREFLSRSEGGYVAVKSRHASKLSPSLAICLDEHSTVHDYVVFSKSTGCESP